MKKSRIFLTATLVITIVTGAIAVKAHTKGAGDRFCKTTLNGTCSATKDYDTNGSSSYFCSTVSQAVCQGTTVATANVELVGE